MIAETIDLLSEDNAAHHSAGGWLAELQELLAIDVSAIDLKQAFRAYETVIARAFDATDCAIVLLNRSKQRRLSNPIDSSVDDHKTVGRKPAHHLSLIQQDSKQESTATRSNKLPTEENTPTHAMTHPLNSNGRMIGFISIQGSKAKFHPPCTTRGLLDIVTGIIIKAIQIKQLHNLISMRCRIAALKKPTDADPLSREIAESPYSLQTAKTCATLIYQEMIKSGFSYNNIIYVASEIISELNHSIKNFPVKEKIKTLDANSLSS